MPLVNASALDTSPVEYTVADVIPRVGLGIWRGASHIGKSLVVTTDMALSVCNGVPFFGHETIQGNVVACYGEGTYDAGIRIKARIAREHRDRAARAREIAREQGEEAAATYEAALLPYTDERLFVLPHAFSIPFVKDTEDGHPGKSLLQTIAEFQQVPDLEMVIIDALPDFAGGSSISNDTCASRYVMGLKYLVAALDCMIICVHHNTVKGDKMIGAGRFFNAADFIASLAREATEPGEPVSASITSEKNKYGPLFKAMSYTIEEHEWDEPPQDEEGNEIPGELVRVQSASVRPRDAGDIGGLAVPGPPGILLPGQPGDPAGFPRAARPALTLPEIRDVVRPRKRSGLRAVPHSPLPATPEAPAAAAGTSDEAQRSRLVAGLLSRDCADCGIPPGLGCNPAITWPGLTRLAPDTGDGELVIHASRMAAAVTTGAVPLDDVLGQFPAGMAPAALTALEGQEIAV